MTANVINSDASYLNIGLFSRKHGYMFMDKFQIFKRYDNIQIV